MNGSAVLGLGNLVQLLIPQWPETLEFQTAGSCGERVVAGSSIIWRPATTLSAVQLER